MEEFKDHENIVVKEVDCDGSGKDLCAEAGIKGFPTIKYGDPLDLLEYENGRDYESLKKFADELKPSCGVFHPNLCSEEVRKEIDELLKTPKEELEERVKSSDAEAKKIESAFEEEVQKLQEQYKQLV